MAKKKILFIHQNFPGQYKSLAPFLSNKKKYEIHSLSVSNNDPAETKERLSNFKDITNHLYIIKKGTSKNIHPLAVEFETKMIRAEAVSLKCLELKNNGFNPDLVIDHPGWGETFLIKEIWPDTKLLSYFEFYYNTANSDVDFDTNEPHYPKPGLELFSRLRARNSPGMMSYLDADLLMCPTKFQKSTAPKILHKKINVIHDGIDTDIIRPVSTGDITLTLPSEEKIKLSKDNKIITFVNRNLEPYRGYHSFMRSLPNIQKEHPDAYILIIGGDEVSYGSSSITGESFKDIYFNEVKNDLMDPEKILFLGRINYGNFLKILALSSVHVYLTYPFVLSWSMLEAMALETLIIGSKTAPVEEVIKNNKNGLLVDFFDIEGLSKLVIDVLSNPEKYKLLKKNARKTIVNNYDLNSISLPKQLELVEALLK